MIEEKLYKKIQEVLPICCVDVVILNKNKEFLLLKRKNEPAKDQWWVPGGRIKKGEKTEKAVLRKVKEETGLNIKIKKMLGVKETIFKKGFFGNFSGEAAEFMLNLAKGAFVFPEWAERKSDEKAEKQLTLSPGEKLVAEGVEAKVSKLLFKSSIRFAYIARSDVFNKANIAAVLGAFKQFNTVNMNGFKPNSDVGTSADYPFFKKRREYLKKKNFIERFIKRKWPSKPKGKDFTLNAEELATVYHYPLVVVKAPTLRHVESKKAEPPVSLPVG